jgi:hypothetical protein
MHPEDREQIERLVVQLNDMRDMLVKLSIMLKDHQFDIDEQSRQAAGEIVNQALTAVKNRGSK